MIDRKRFLDDCKRLVGTLESDLIARSHVPEGLPEAVEALRAEYAKAKDADRTAQNFEDWRTDYATLQAAAWILSAVFVRFLEDNRLIEPPRIAGPGPMLQRARDEHTLYFREHPTETDREYLLRVFREVGKLPGGREIFGKHNSVFEMPNWLSGDAAGEILQFFQRIESDTGALVHDFTDPEWDTRFLGDLYQDLSEAARKKFALLQTPVFVEEFILDRTLDPALDEFGLDAPPVKNSDGDEISGPGFRMIDPACGPGHFLLGAFRRILERWQRKDPGANVRDLVQRSLDSIHGVDINPYAIAIARFRLLIEALSACSVSKLKDSPAFHFNLAAGDSLLHGVAGQGVFEFHDLAHHYHAEDIDALRKILRPGAYHAVVANPPYITVKDKVLNQAYRERYSTCHMKYSLAVPFMERILGLCVRDGYTGQITSNSFMKREFGKKLIEDFIPCIDLTHVIDTSGAYIPGHGTPTVILFARQRRPVAKTLRTVLGIRGEPLTPEDPERGLVWQAILAQVDRPGSSSDFVSAGDSARELFYAHPWSIGGGGAAELKERLESAVVCSLDELADEIGVLGMTNADELMLASGDAFQRLRVERAVFRRLALGDEIRDWAIAQGDFALLPYEEEKLIPLEKMPGLAHWCWPCRTTLGNRATFAKQTYFLEGRPWWEWHQIALRRLRTPLSIVFAFVATHNHFVLDRGGKVFNRSAPVIKLPADATEDEHLALLGLLNSSTACFWMKQVFHNKGDSTDSEGARVAGVEAWIDTFEHDGTKLKQFPLPAARPLKAARILDLLAQELQTLSPGAALERWADGNGDDLRFNIQSSRYAHYDTWNRMIALQEELDWQCYRLYGLADDASLEWGESRLDDLPMLELGQRAFEIVLARQVEAGDLETTWFARHGSAPITEIPKNWPVEYRELVERRIEVIENHKSIGLIEQPEYKRRWNLEPWESQLERALREWLLNRLERYFDFDGRMNDEGAATAKWDIAVCSTAYLADIARQDRQFMEVAEVYTNDPAFDVTKLVTELVEQESVPLLPILRYKPSGLRKRAEWEETWALQRREDAVDARTKLPIEDPHCLSEHEAERLKKREVGDIAVPPKYTSADFLKSHYWRLRGKLDVPKERWVSFHHCEGPDGALAIAWAGYNHLQLARAVSAYYVDVQERLGGADDPRLTPLLACLIELLPWLKQWHNDIDPEFNMAMGDYFEGFILEEARKLGKTLDDIRAWQPPKTASTRGRRKAKATK